MTKCADVYKKFFKPGEVVEIRAYGLNRSNKTWEGWAGGVGIVFGYFDNAEAFGAAAEALDVAGAHGVYFTINPCKPDLLARAANRLKAATQKSISTSDHDILCIRWLPIDLDPRRPAGISSTDAELSMALEMRGEIIKWMKDEFKLLWPIQACSGNGAHLIYRAPDLDNNEKNKLIIKHCLHALAEAFPAGPVEVDLTVFNPARIWKVYGTMARKGDNTPDRPWRKSYLEEGEI